MRTQWQELRELVWSSRYDPIASHKHRAALLEIFLAVAIALAAGPEIFAAMEMTALMELLGGFLFLTAMRAGVKLVALNIWNTIVSISLPVPPAAIIRPDASIPLKSLAFVYIVAIALWSWALALNCQFIGSPDCSECRS